MVYVIGASLSKPHIDGGLGDVCMYVCIHQCHISLLHKDM